MPAAWSAVGLPLALSVCMFLGLSLHFSWVYAQPQPFTMLEAELQRAGQDSGRVRLLVAGSTQCLQTDIDLSLKYGNEALDLAKKLEFASGEAAAWGVLGLAHSSKGEYTLALTMLRKGFLLYEQQSDLRGASSVLMSIAAVYRSRNQYSEALQTALRALQSAERTGDRPMIARAYNAIGEVYLQQGDTANSAEYLHRALKLQEKDSNQQELANTLNNLGALKMRQNDYPAALQNYARALGMQLQLGAKQATATTLGNIGEAYIRQEQYDAALETYTKSLSLNQQMGDQEGVALSFNRLGTLYLLLKKYDSAESYLRRGLITASGIGSRDVQMRSYTALARLDSARGDFASAFDRFKQAAALKDTLFGAQQARQVAELQAQRELEEREYQIALLERDNAVQRRYRNILIALIVLAVAAALASLYGFITNRRKNTALQKANDEIQRQSSLLEEQSAQITLKNTELQQANYEYEFTVEKVFQLNQDLMEQAASADSLQKRVDEQNAEMQRINAMLDDFRRTPQ
jgi:tetratricopeptide (TPR) repeat protein